MDSYATAAQVIPTLFIAMAVGGGMHWRVVETRPRPPHIPAYSVEDELLSHAATLTALVMVVGEMSALMALTVGHPSRAATLGSWAGLVAGLVGVAGPVVRHHARQADNQAARARVLAPALVMVGFLAGIFYLVVLR